MGKNDDGQREKYNKQEKIGSDNWKKMENVYGKLKKKRHDI